MINNPPGLEELRKRVEKHDKDLYEGNGKPALVVRVALTEERIATVTTSVDEIKKDNRTIRNMVIGLILTVVGEIIVKVVLH